MKALSVKQPWAWLIADGLKTIETRTWKTEYRGDLLIVSSKGIDEQAAMMFDQNPDGLILGHALAVVEIFDCVQMHLAHVKYALCDYYPGAYSWKLRNIRKLAEPFPVKGHLSIYEVETPELRFVA